MVAQTHLRTPAATILPTSGDAAALFDFGTARPATPSILALKLDHLGDFIIGLPSLRQLRETFPASHIRLIVSSWNRRAAEQCGLADEVVTYDFFSATGWEGQPNQPLDEFRRAASGHFSIAIDLRVDEDTRALLAEVDADLRCGIGSRVRHKFLDIALPPQRRQQGTSGAADCTQFFAPDRFTSKMPFKHAFYHETDFRPVQGHLVYGPRVTLPVGHLRATFDLRLTGLAVSARYRSVTLDVARNGADMLAAKRLRWRERLLPSRHGIALEFENADADAQYEFRIFIQGKPLLARLRFGGVRVDRIGTALNPAFQTTHLHIGEQLSLLVTLVGARTRPLYDETVPPAGSGRKQVAVAPFGNRDLRDWPASHYAELIRLLMERHDCDVILLGSKEQVARLNHLRRDLGDSARVRNLGGETAWCDLPALLRQADLVVCNNSGIAHLAASSGAVTLAIFSASHLPQVWGPRGQNSHALVSVVPCSPCGLERISDCPHDHRCMRGLAPTTVFAQASRLLQEPRR